MQQGFEIQMILCPTSEDLSQALWCDQVAWQGVDDLAFQGIAATMQHTTYLTTTVIVIQHCFAWFYDFATKGTATTLLNQKVCSDLGYVLGPDLIHLRGQSRTQSSP
jgi:hypothetical protein